MKRLTKPVIVPETGEIFAYMLESGVTETKARTKLGKLEDLEEQGRLLVLPCKVGDTVWQIHTLPRTNRKIIAEVKADAFFITLCTLEGRFGKTVFLTREEAEAALEKMKGEEHE